MFVVNEDRRDEAQGCLVYAKQGCPGHALTAAYGDRLCNKSTSVYRRKCKIRFCFVQVIMFVSVSRERRVLGQCVRCNSTGDGTRPATVTLSKSANQSSVAIDCQSGVERHDLFCQDSWLVIDSLQPGSQACVLSVLLHGFR